MAETKPLLLTHHLANVLLQSASHLKLPEILSTGIIVLETFIIIFTAVIMRKSCNL